MLPVQDFVYIFVQENKHRVVAQLVARGVWDAQVAGSSPAHSTLKTIMKTSGNCETYPLLTITGDAIKVDPRMDPETEARLRAVAERLKGKELFPESVARAKAMLAGIKSLPH